jgi:hypothetical protein
LGVKYPISTWVLSFFKFSTWVFIYFIGGPEFRDKTHFGTSVILSVQILTVRHVSTAEVDTWHYIKKIFKNNKKYIKKMDKQKKEEEEEKEGSLKFLNFLNFFLYSATW